MTSGTTSRPLLEINNLSVSYGKATALSNFSLRLHEGQLVTVVGPNGAGKSTMLAAIAGLLPYSGDIAFEGKLCNPLSVEERVASGINLVPEKRELFTTMTVEDNLALGAFQRHRDGHRDAQLTQAEMYALFPRLFDRRKQLAGTLSGGERQMLALARALMAKPKLQMLDEPSLGLAPIVVRDIFRIIATLRSRGVAILLVEQNARAALQLADYAYVLETGQTAMEGDAAVVRDDPRVIETYLGLGSRHQEMLST